MKNTLNRRENTLKISEVRNTTIQNKHCEKKIIKCKRTLNLKQLRNIVSGLIHITQRPKSKRTEKNSKSKR